MEKNTYMFTVHHCPNHYTYLHLVRKVFLHELNAQQQQIIQPEETAVSRHDVPHQDVLTERGVPQVPPVHQRWQATFIILLIIVPLFPGHSVLVVFQLTAWNYYVGGT